MKHGPIALIDEDMPVVVVCPKDVHYELIAVCTVGDIDVRRICTYEGAPLSTRGGS